METMKNMLNKKIFVMSYFLKNMWAYNRFFYLLFFVYISFMVIQPLVNVFCPRYIIDEISSTKNMKTIILIVLIMIGVTFLVNTMVSILENQLNRIYYEDFNRLLEANIGKKSMELKYATTENKKALDYISNAKLGINNGYSGGMSGFFKAFSLLTSNLCILLVTGIVIIKYSWTLLLIVAINVGINLVANQKQNQIQLAQFEKLSFIDRAYYYLLHTLSDIKYGKDIRLFGAKKMMIDRVDSFNYEQSQIQREQAKKTKKYILTSKINIAVTAVLTYLILVWMTLDNRISIGEFTMLATAVSTLVLAMNNVFLQILDLNKFNKYAEKYVDFIEKNEFEHSGDKICDFDKVEIEFRNVSFKYPNNSEYALKNINVVIHDREQWSVVGLNGAGKTTFIKLLCRLYECTEGEILLNGINILEYEYTSYIKLIAAVFQDFQLLNFSIKENIIIDDGDKVKDEEIWPLIERVGLTDKVNSLPKGLDTPVFRYYDMSGFEPSGGEQQKLAMARALYKDAPILVLDEPTAALDPISEKEVYEKFKEMTKDKIAIFISHRLASCKFCEKILVFNEGTIVEQGTHDSLVKIPDGLYAKMFKAQEKYYV